jgi:hypothetical protein
MHFLGFGNDAGYMQQSLGWNATAEQARSAQPRFGFHQRDRQPQIGSQKSGSVSPGTAAHDNQRGMHEVSSLCAMPDRSIGGR